MCGQLEGSPRDFSVRVQARQMLSLVGDYGGSSDDEAGVDVGTRSTASPRSTSATGAQPQAQPHAAPSTSASEWALPSASALLGSSSLNAGSGGLHAHVTLTASVGGPQRWERGPSHYIALRVPCSFST